MQLTPNAVITPEELERGKQALVKDAAWATLAGSLYGGVILVGFALALGASPFLIGLLAAIPFFSQCAQLPAIALVERLRQRRTIAVYAASAARLLILLLALVPYLSDAPAQLALLIAAQLGISLLGSVSVCSLNSWLHQLLHNHALGALFARRLLWSTVLGALGALFAGQLVQHWPFSEQLHAYAVLFAAAAAAGFVSSLYLSRVPEPRMGRPGPALPVLAMLRAPFRDMNFRRVIVFMGAWNFASNLAAPFIAVYLLKQLDFRLGTVTLIGIASQAANALTLYLWGRLSDRLSNKAILAAVLPVYFASLLALPFTALPEPHALTLPLLLAIHVVMGAASGGIVLATGNIGLKLAPQGQGTAYLASVSLVGAVAAGVAALAGGALASWFSARQLAISLHWASPQDSKDLMVLQFSHWEFLFAIAFALGAYVLHALSRIQEGREISERTVVQEFTSEAVRSLDQLPSVAGLRAAMLFPFGRLAERRRQPRS